MARRLGGGVLHRRRETPGDESTSGSCWWRRIRRSRRVTTENEAALRAALVLSVAEPESRPELLLRRGRVVSWVEDALAPLHGRLTEGQIGRLARAVRAAAGIEAMIWLCDVGGLDRAEAVKLMKWSAQALLQAAIADAEAV
jgi:hypothetical protein